MPGIDPSTRLSTGSASTSLRLGVDGRVDHHDAGHLGRPGRRRARSASAPPSTDRRRPPVVVAREALEGPLELGVPVGPRGAVELLPGGPVAGQPRHLDGVPLVGERLAPGRDRGGGSGEPVAQQHADAATAGQLGSAAAGQGRGERGGRPWRRILHQDREIVLRGRPEARVERSDRCAGWRGGGAVFYWFLKWIALGPLLRLVFRPQTDGVENVPDEGPAILASNHLSYADWLFMPLTLPRRVTFVAKAEYFTTPGHQGLVPEEVLLRAPARCRSTGPAPNAAEGALSSAQRILERGRPLRHLPRGHALARRAALPRQDRGGPAGARDQRAGDPGGGRRHRRRRPAGQEVRHARPARCVRFGKPLDFSRYEGMENDRYILRSITDEIMYEIMRLSGQEYVDMYAARRQGTRPRRRRTRHVASSGKPRPRPRRSGRPDQPPGTGRGEIRGARDLRHPDDAAGAGVEDRLFDALAVLPRAGRDQHGRDGRVAVGQLPADRCHGVGGRRDPGLDRVVLVAYRDAGAGPCGCWATTGGGGAGHGHHPLAQGGRLPGHPARLLGDGCAARLGGARTGAEVSSPGSPSPSWTWPSGRR